MRITLPSVNARGMTAPICLHDIVSRNGLVGAYDFTSGNLQRCLINQNPAGPPLLQIGAPRALPGRIIVGGGNGFDTQLAETQELTYLAVASREDYVNETGANDLAVVGNFNDDPAATLRYGADLRMADSTPASNNVMSYRARSWFDVSGTQTAFANSTNSTGRTPFANGSLFEFWGMTIGAGLLNIYQPRAQANPVQSSAQAGYATRRLLTDTGNPIRVLIGSRDDSTKGQLNAALALILIYSRPLSQSEVNAQYQATRAQLQNLSSGGPLASRFAAL